MLCLDLALPEQELITLGTTETLATAVTPESDLVLLDILRKPTRGNVAGLVGMTMEANTSKLLATF